MINLNELYKYKKENELLRSQVTSLRLLNKNLNIKLEKLENNTQKLIQEAVTKSVNEVKKEYEKTLKSLNNKIEKLESKLNTNSSNSSLPGTHNKIGVKISNTRVKTGLSKGGQKGHKRNILEKFTEEEITERLDHTLNKCPKCNNEIEEKNVFISDVLDFNITISKVRNKVYKYYCSSCNETISANNNLKPGTSYGNNVNASAVVLMNEANVPINKVRKHITGLTNGEINLSEGYISKLQKITASKLDTFLDDLKAKILKSKVIHWDDTNIKIETKQGYLRFYGNEKLALIKAHESKNKEGIEKDGILTKLNEKNIVVHDHILYNYNPDLEYQNAECNAHILRYLQGVSDNIHTHKWEKELAELLKEALKNREGKTSYEKEYIENIYSRYKEIINLGYKENLELAEYHFYKEPQALSLL